MKLFCHLDVGVGVGVHFKVHDMGKVLLDELSSKHTGLVISLDEWIQFHCFGHFFQRRQLKWFIAFLLEKPSNKRF